MYVFTYIYIYILYLQYIYIYTCVYIYIQYILEKHVNIDIYIYIYTCLNIYIYIQYIYIQYIYIQYIYIYICVYVYLIKSNYTLIDLNCKLGLFPWYFRMADKPLGPKFSSVWRRFTILTEDFRYCCVPGHPIFRLPVFLLRWLQPTLTKACSFVQHLNNNRLKK